MYDGQKKGRTLHGMQTLALVGYCARRLAWTLRSYLAAEVFANTHAKCICEYVAKPQHQNHCYGQVTSCWCGRGQVVVVSRS